MDEEIIKLTFKLISIPSTRDNIWAIEKSVEIIADELRDFNITRFLSNQIPSLLVSNQKADEKKFRLILNAHIDVVPGESSQFTPILKGKKLFGRGSYDMKGAAVSEIIAFKKIAKKCNFPIALQIVGDEEIGGYNGTKLQIDKGVRGDFILIGEPTNFDINFRSKGVLSIQLSTKGKGSHAALPWEGKNALEQIVKDVSNLLKSFPTPSKPVWKTTFNLSWIKTTNNSVNKVPDDATAQFDIRFIPEDKIILLNKIKKIVDNNTQIIIKTFDPPQEVEKSNCFLKMLEKSILRVTKHNPKLVSQHFASDIRHFNEVGCKGASVGPIGSGLHSANEWVDLESLEQYRDVLIDLIENLNSKGSKL